MPRRPCLAQHSRSLLYNICGSRQQPQDTAAQDVYRWPAGLLAVVTACTCACVAPQQSCREVTCSCRLQPLCLAAHAPMGTLTYFRPDAHASVCISPSLSSCITGLAHDCHWRTTQLQAHLFSLSLTVWSCHCFRAKVAARTHDWQGQEHGQNCEGAEASLHIGNHLSLLPCGCQGDAAAHNMMHVRQTIALPIA